MNMLFRITAVVGVAIGVASPTETCPFCDSRTAEEVRAGIFNSDFGLAKMAVMGPIKLAVAGGVVLIIAAIVWMATRRR